MRPTFIPAPLPASFSSPSSRPEIASRPPEAMSALSRLDILVDII